MPVFLKGKDKLKGPSIAPVEGCVTSVEEICDKAREAIMQAVMRHYQKNPNSPWSGIALADLERTLKALYKSWGIDIKDEFRKSLPDVMKEFMKSAKEAYWKDGTRQAVIGEPDPKRVQYFLDSSYQQVAMRTDKMQFDHIRQLRQLSADVLRETSMTGATRREVSKKMLDKALQIPGFQFTDNAGRKWQNKSYFTMLARTELMNAGRASYDETCAADGYDVMLLSVSGDSCEHCRKWEGRCFSLTGATKGLPTKAELEAEGVFHPNCTHSYSAVPDYIWRTQYNPDGSKRDRPVEYTPSDEELSRLKELDNLDKPVDQEPKRVYEWAGDEIDRNERSLAAATYETPEAERLRDQMFNDVAQKRLPEITMYAARHGMTTKEYIDKASERLDELMVGCHVYHRDVSGILDVILKSGRFKSQFETGTSQGSLARDARSKTEYVMHGFGAELSSDKSDPYHNMPDTKDLIKHKKEYRAIYGFIAHEADLQRSDGDCSSNCSELYGDIIFKMYDRVKSRTTWMARDSLGVHHLKDTLASKVDKPSILSLHTGCDILDKDRYPDYESLRWSYNEAQIYGGLPLEEVEFVYVKKGQKAGRLDNGKPILSYDETVRLLDKYGIPHRDM